MSILQIPRRGLMAMRSGGTTIDTLNMLLLNELTEFSFDERVTAIPREFAYYKSALTKVRFPSGTVTMANDAFRATSLSDVNYLHGSGSMGKNEFTNCKFSVFCFSGFNNSNGYNFQGCTNLTTLDISGDFQIAAAEFHDTPLSTLILRSASVRPLKNTSAFLSTPFASGGTGGTIYIPKSLYDHLGDGTAYDYKAASNWSTVDGYGTITWKSIESTHTDPNAPIDLTLYYADGTPVPTT